MIHYYTNRQIADKLEVNLARWKRWSRSFLPPDPLGGMQSGYARQYLFKDLFKVYLGGHLLSHHKLNVVESRQILVDMTPWLKKTGYFELNGNNGAASGKETDDFRVLVYFAPSTATGAKNRPSFTYLVHRFANGYREEGDFGQWLRIDQSGIDGDLLAGNTFFNSPYVHLINIGALRTEIIDRLKRR